MEMKITADAIVMVSLYHPFFLAMWLFMLHVIDSICGVWTTCCGYFVGPQGKSLSLCYNFHQHCDNSCLGGIFMANRTERTQCLPYVLLFDMLSSFFRLCGAAALVIKAFKFNSSMSSFESN